MARLFPNKPAGAVRPETAKVLHALRRIPGDDWLVWLSLPLSAGWRPALMAIHRNESCHLIAVSGLTEGQIETALHGDLFASSGETFAPADLERAQRERLHAFRRAALADGGCEYGGGRLPIFPALAFPNVPQALLDQIALKGGIADCLLWGRETLRSEQMQHAMEASATGRPKLPDSMLDILRERFSPEIGIPDALVARVQEKPDRSLGAKLTSFLLDVNQEFLAKEDLMLSPEADETLRELRLRLVTGVAGSGKSLILLYRAMLQKKLNPGARLLVLTHNRPLSGELRDRFRRLYSGAGAQWATFYQWCRDFAETEWNIIPPWEREALLQQLAARFRTLSSLPLSFLAEEIDWMRDHGLSSRDQYLAAPRAGRKRALREDQRHAVFSLLQQYEAELQRRGLQDWPGAAFAVWRRVREGLLHPPVYDGVFIDEAQFFAPTWFRLIKRAVRPGSGQLFVAADPTQGFLKRRHSWLSTGLDVRGHSARLLRCYRNTREILAFAARFYRSRISEDDEEINLPEPAEMELLAPGEPPQLLHVDSAQGERARVANEIASALRAGANPQHFLALFADAALIPAFLQLLNKLAGRPVGREMRHASYSGEYVRVSALNAATGLESPIVFLCGLDSVLEKEGAPGLADDERSELIRDNTRRIYMGMTRASRKLVITYRRARTREQLDVGSRPAASGSQGG